MTDQILNILKVALLALLYLFFARVVWAVWSEVRTPVAATPRRTAVPSRDDKPQTKKIPRGASTFVVIEPREHRGTRYQLADTLTLGRAADSDIDLSADSYASQHHARIETRGDGVWIVDLGSTNGTFVNGNRVGADKSLRKGDRIQTGSTVMELN